jgi:murein tripeptide amidase MpaA
VIFPLTWHAAAAAAAFASLNQVPNLAPDATSIGYYRTGSSGLNFNRVWDQASPTFAPELYATQQAMKARGVDFYLDIHNIE